MPRYDYRCTRCDHRFELRQSFHSDPVADCLECGAPSQRQIHAPPVIFKGSGWYVTDYGKGRGNNGLGKSEEKDEKAEKSDSGSGKSKSASSEGKSGAASASTSGKND